MNLVVLDLVDAGPPVDYCVHGQATCAGCGIWLWLGPETYPRVSSGTILPVCRGCVIAHDSEAATRVGRIEDRGAH